MAERTVNITINYKVNTAEVQKAQAASQAAQKATDDLRRATENYSKASTTAHKQVADATKKAQGETVSLTKDFTSLYNSVRLFLTAGLAKQLLDITLNMAKLSGQVEGVTRAFNRLPNATLLLRSLREATHGTVNDLELMQRALMAQNFKIPLEKLGTLLEFAAVKAQQTGQEVNHLVNYIVSGIGYRSIKRLDDLGFTANRVKEALGGVSLQTATMGQVMDAVTKLMQEDLEKTGGFIETSETDVKNLTKAVHELNVEVSEQATNRGFIQFLGNVVNLVRQAAKAQWNWVDALVAGNPLIFAARRLYLMQDVDLQERITELAEQQAAAFERKNKFAKEGESLLNTDRELFNLAQSIRLNEDTQKQAAERVKHLREEIAALKEKNTLSLIDKGVGIQKPFTEASKLIAEKEKEIKKIEESNKALEQNHEVLAQVIQILVEYRDSIVLANMAEGESLGLIEKKRAEIESLQEQIEKTSSAGDLGESGKLVEALKRAQKELDILLGEEIELHKFLAQLSDDELAKTKQILADKAEQRKRDAERERDNNKRSYEHWEYYEDLKARKLREQEEEKIEIMEDNAAKAREIQRTMFELTEELMRSTLDLALTSGEEETDAIRRRYDQQIQLAGDNERAKTELRIKQERELDKAREVEKQKEKKNASTRILIDGLTAIAKIFAQFGWPSGIAPAAIMAGITATNVAQVRRYAKGGLNIPGPGTETSDSIPALLSRGESVMTAEETRKNFGLLTMMKENKIDDRIMKSIDFSGGRQMLNDSRIVDVMERVEKQLSRLKPPDIVSDAGVIYEVHKDEEGNRKRRMRKIF